jgi:hypothetical protein
MATDLLISMTRCTTAPTRLPHRQKLLEAGTLGDLQLGKATNIPYLQILHYDEVVTFTSKNSNEETV